MNLHTLPGNPAPEGAIVSAVRTHDGLLLRVARWAAPNARGTVVLCSGRAEFVEKYFETIAELLMRRFDVVAMDWRGQGGSPRELADPAKGYIADFSVYDRDFEALVRQVLQPFCPRPWFGLAHSMGGAIMAAQARQDLPFARLVLTAPMIDLAMLRYPRATRRLVRTLTLAGLGRAYIPGGDRTSVMLQPFEGNVLTADKGRFARMASILKAAPQLAIGDPTLAWVNAAFRFMRRFENPDGARRTHMPILILASGADRVVSTPAIERFASYLKAGSCITIPAARHEILMERDAVRGQFWAAFDAFIPGEGG